MSEPVVIDTHIFNRSVTDGGEYRGVLEAMIERCDRLLVNKRIIKEYLAMAPRAGVNPTLILGETMPKLKRLGKLEKTGNRRVDVGSEQDRRFIGAALSGQSRVIVSNDPTFRTTPVKRILQRAHVKVLYPHEYVRGT